MNWHIKKLENGVVEIWSFFAEEGPIIRCYPDGRIELSEGGMERFDGNYPTICAAMEVGETWT